MAKTIQEVDITRMRELLRNGAVLVDVREDEELEDGAIEGHIHMPLSAFADFKDAIAKDKPTVFYCRSGRRSMKAAEIAAQWTNQPLYSLAGGYLGYANQE